METIETVRCAVCEHEFPIPAVALCPNCGGRQIRRRNQREAEILKREVYDAGVLDHKPLCKHALWNLIAGLIR